MSSPTNASAHPGIRFVLVDLEATCWERCPPAPHEVIEIGSVCFQSDRGVLGEFQTFVRPLLRPDLSPFCRELTSILQSEVDPAPSFPTALAQFTAWTDAFAPFVLAAWGAYDRKQLQQDCRLHGFVYPFVNYVNVKQAFARIERCRPCGMAAALRMMGLPLEGTHHRGIDDARNIARLLEHLLRQAGVGAVLREG